MSSREITVFAFEKEWQSIRKNNKEYGKTMHKLTNNQGIIMNLSVP